jgi:putative heme transporter
VHRFRFPRRRGRSGSSQPTPPVAPEPVVIGRVFAAPRWLRDLGRLSWILVGLGLVLLGGVWLLGQMSVIVAPVVAGTIAAAVAGPAVTRMQRRRIPRAAGAGIVLLVLLALGVVVALLVLGPIVGNGDEIRSEVSKAVDTIEGWAQDAGADDTAGAREGLTTAVPDAGTTLLHGVADGIDGLTSLAFFLSFFFFSTFFLLKDGPTFHRFIDRHLGIPVQAATLITGNVLDSLRRYFLGVTIVAVFNGAVAGLGALILGVPLVGAITAVTIVTAYVPFIGAFVAGAFAVAIALGSEGLDTALAMLVIVLLANGGLQQIVQPIAFGATLDLNPLVVLIVTIAGGGLFGMVGLILAAPITSAAVHITRDLALAREDAPGHAGSGEPLPAEP